MSRLNIDAKTATLVGLLVVVVAAIVWVSHAENTAIRLHLPPVLPEPTTLEGIKLTDWISAIGTAVGAVLTAGALLIAAFTYKHQVDERIRAAEDRRQRAEEKRQETAERIRAQAARVPVLTSNSEIHTDVVVMEVRNDSLLPIRDVLLICFDRSGREMGQNMQQVIATGESLTLERPRRVIDKVSARFTDDAGAIWRRHVNGDLEKL